jgi:hypothetical protein
MKKGRFPAALLALAAGLGHWYLTGIAQRLAYRGFAPASYGGLVSLLANAAIEESLRMAFITAAAFVFTRDPEGSATRKKARLYAFALLAGWAFGSMENVSYLLAYPTLDVFWRLAYSLPIHINAGILYALALFPMAREGRVLNGPSRIAAERPRAARSAAAWAPTRASAPSFSASRSPALRAASALIIGLTWHGAFNAFASLGFFNGLPALGGALNALAFLTLAFFIERDFIATGAFHGRTRA